VQMIFARRKGAVSGEQRDGEELSDMVEGRDIVTVARRPSHVVRNGAVLLRKKYGWTKMPLNLCQGAYEYPAAVPGLNISYQK
jgi:hypothetical protein